MQFTTAGKKKEGIVSRILSGHQCKRFWFLFLFLLTSLKLAQTSQDNRDCLPLGTGTVKDCAWLCCF